ncbi:ATP phosphoribosyltransferase [Exiguobacterium sp. KRL4]|uniref:ATP phosphoribosyltransferase n=1 Tax=Exiguobacterium sp. KRL4 TaxID=1914536 RepID=UPI0008F84AD7|nr:ATP phosphoribosyltransferase [Exiguobacterium sp. KRL4]OIN66546.1 ATP phosphoribosyltransferase [Exiguobacterium sp. KRL4]
MRIGITKGRLSKTTERYLKEAGVETWGAIERELIVKRGKHEFVFMKGSDLIPYVAQGVLDVAITGSDILLESDQELSELAELPFGVCRMSVCAKEPLQFEGGRRVRIATKYPVIAKRYFSELGVDVDIVPLNGSVELAPLLGLADAIVDIVETGETLRANGLNEYEKIIDINARFFTSEWTLKRKRVEVIQLLEQLTEGVTR